MYECIIAKLYKQRTDYQKDNHNFVRSYYFKLWEKNFLQVFGGARGSLYLIRLYLDQLKNSNINLFQANVPFFPP